MWYIAEALPGRLLEAAQVALDLLPQSGCRRLVAQVVDGAAAGDREARWNRNAEIGHFGEVRALPAQHRLHVLRALGPAVPEEVHARWAGH